MKVQQSQVTKLLITEVKALDPVTVYLEDFGPGKGKITIECFGKAWSSYWGGMSGMSIAKFFCSCDEHYIAKNLSSIDGEIYDIDAIRTDAEEKGIGCYRDDPWHDYEFMHRMYGHDPVEWSDAIPMKPNPDYQYLCRIIKAVQAGLKDIQE